MKIISISMIISGKTATVELSPFALSSIVPPLPAPAFEDMRTLQPLCNTDCLAECTVRERRWAGSPQSFLSGTVALHVVAQAVVLTSVRFIGRRTGEAADVLDLSRRRGSSAGR